MSEEDILDITERIANHGWSDYDNLEENKKAIQGLLDLYYKQQKEIESIEESCNTCFELQQKEKEELRDKIREIISKYINVQEHFKYTNQELYGKDLRNMIKELLEV